MNEPDFHEIQRQHMIFAELFHKFGLMPRVFPPIVESELGWDIGLHLPWFEPALPLQNGCNFFIQLKLSTEQTHSSATGWKCWKQSFLRFNLGYRRKREWDYTQEIY